MKFLFLKGLYIPGQDTTSWRHKIANQGSRLLHSPSLVALGLSLGYETWPRIGWHQAFVIAWSKYRLGLPSAPLHYGLTWPVGIPTVFHTPVTISLDSPNGIKPAIRVVQEDCERVYQGSDTISMWSDLIKGPEPWTLTPYIWSYHTIIVTSALPCLKLLVTALFVQQLIPAVNNKNIKALQYWAFVRVIYRWPVDSPHQRPAVNMCWLFTPFSANVCCKCYDKPLSDDFTQ